MTDDEALGLVPGDRVVTKVGTTAGLAATVVGVCDGRGVKWLGCVRVTVRRDGVDKNGRRLPAMDRRPAAIELLSRIDPLAANIFADWLEENGELRAAMKLRAAFPVWEGVTA
jgi:hypothetical protein